MHQQKPVVRKTFTDGILIVDGPVQGIIFLYGKMEMCIVFALRNMWGHMHRETILTVSVSALKETLKLRKWEISRKKQEKSSLLM